MAKRDYSEKKRGKQIIAVALRKYDSQVHPSGETLSDAVRVYRVVTALLQAGVPLSKANIFRHLLDESGFALSDFPNLCKLIPFILQDEV